MQLHERACALNPAHQLASRRLTGPGAERVLIAFDGMRVPLAHLPALPRLMPAVMAALEPLESAEVANALQVPAQHAATLLQTE